jgi:hypothetical protein
MSREACFTALFNLLSALKTSGAVATCDRRVKLIGDVGNAELPAIYLAGDKGSYEQDQGMPPKRTLGALIYVYAANPDRHTSAGIVLNGLLDGIEAALAPDWTGVQTLGGLVAHCWIEGSVEVFEGAQGERAAAIVPVKMLMP